jgi:hypothetical protein
MKGSNKHTKSLNCKVCGEEVRNVGEDAVKVTCSSCVNKLMQTGILPSEEDEISDNDDQ